MTGERPWYQDAIIYQLHVRAFHDSNGDGIGDFRGLTQKLDYLQDLGVTALWLLPFYPSPLRDDGYDIADYTDVHPAYGTLRDFRTFLKEAHRRDLRVITELVINHTSDQHPWFQRSRRAKPGSRWRDYYVWSDTPDKYQDARIIFKDFEPSNWTWDPVAHAYFWHRFYAHQPDLNFDNPAVHRAVISVLDFWLDMGVDGLRLDAVPYLHEREGTNCENLPETHAVLRKLRRHVDRKYGDRMLLAEANQWPDDAVAYFGDGDECHMAFHFPVMPRLFMAVHTEDRFPIVDILEQTPPVPTGAQWAIFLRNHDELTLEMVTDEDRDYMYRVYAQDPRARINLGIRRRLAPLMGNNRRKIELMNSLLFSLPGTPVVYYGDEIGMGDNIYLGDRNGVRTPMQWSADRNGGFSRANPQQLYLPVIIDPEYHYEAVNVEGQQNNSHSFLWWVKRLIAQRKRMGVFGAGSVEFLQPENRKVLAFVRRLDDERVLIVANLSRFAQCVELDLGEHEGLVPVELFGQTRFPPVQRDPYFLTLAPHTFYWLRLEAARADEVEVGAATPVPTVRAISVEDLLLGDQRGALERALPTFLRRQRWFGAKARNVLGVEVQDAVAVPYDGRVAYLALLDVSYSEGDPDQYLVPLTFHAGSAGEGVAATRPQAAVARVLIGAGAEAVSGVLFDAMADEAFAAALLRLIPSRRRFKGAAGELRTSAARALRAAVAGEHTPRPTLVPLEQSNTSVIFEERFILKLFRRVDDGVNPDLEVGRFLTDRTSFTHMPPVIGALEYQRPRGEPKTMAVIHGYVPNEGDAWRFTLDALDQYFESALSRPKDAQPAVPAAEMLIGSLDLEPPSEIQELLGLYLETTRLLGQRTGMLHLALASRADDPAFAPEAFTPLYQRSLYQSLRSRAEQVFALLRKRLRTLPENMRSEAADVLGQREALLARLRAVTGRRIGAVRTRCHGDYHLGQVLYTGKDFVILDFEGEPARALGERRLKRSPLTDVAGMLRSFHYASVAALIEGRVRPEDVATLEPWAAAWNAWVGRTFLRSYVDTAAGAPFIPKASAEFQVLLDAFLIEKALYEIQYELNNRPAWLPIPLRGVRQWLAATVDA